MNILIFQESVLINVHARRKTLYNQYAKSEFDSKFTLNLVVCGVARF
jgi:hypothetical protein